MDNEKNLNWEKYSRTTHIIGRTVSVITLVMLIGAPFLIGRYLGAYPDLSAAAKGFVSVGIVWLVSSIAEFLIYTPMRLGRRLPRLYHRQPYQYEDPLRRQCARYGRR